MKSILNENEKQKLLKNFQISGMTQAAFAVENGINPKTLARWIYQSRLQEKQTKDSVEFVELKRTFITQNQKITIRKAGMEIEIPSFDVENFIQILRAVNEL